MDGFSTDKSLELLFGDAPDEFMPVDAFFPQYVDELNSRSKRVHEPGGGPLAGKAPKLAQGQTAGGLPMMQPAAGAAGGMQPPFMGMQPLGAQQQGMLLPGMAGAAAGQLNGGMQLPLPVPMGLPRGMLGMQVPGLMPGGGPQLMGLNLPLDYGAASGGGLTAAGPNLSGTLSGGHGDDDGSGDGKHKKTVKQQEANKVAQQRYRERKKAKFNEMESTIEALSKQLQQLQALQSRNQILEGLNGDLHAQLLHREREVERLKLALDASAERSLGSGPSSPSADGATPASLPPLECNDEGCVSCDVLPQDLAGIDFKQGFSDQMERLRHFLTQHDLLECGATPPAGSVSKELTAELAQIVGRSCQLCQAALRAEGVKVMELISKDPTSLSTVGTAAEQQRWQACLDTMHLTGQQQEALLLNRRSHLQRMRSIYQERHNLNMQAMALMLPHSSHNPAEDNTVEGRMTSMSHSGYLPLARSSAELSNVLDKIKDNLRREQRAVMDLNCVTISKILTPLQAAHYMLIAYPQHCDALALSNTLAKSLGSEDVSDGAPPAHAAATASTAVGAFGLALLFISLNIKQAPGTLFGRCKPGRFGIAPETVGWDAATNSSRWASSCGKLASSAALADEEARWRRKALYSTYSCIKGRYGHNWLNATCAFRNLCLNASTLEFEYYIDPKLPDAPLLYTPAGEPLYEFPDSFVDAGFETVEVYNWSFPVSWAPRVVRRPFPQRGPRVKWAPSPQALLTALYAMPVTTVKNFGHVLYDIAVPLFNMQHLFGIYTPLAQPLLLPGDASNAEVEEKLRELLPKVANNSDPDMNPLRLHWDSYPAYTSDYVRHVLGDGQPGLVCFKTVLVGTGPLNRRIAQTDSRPYRDTAMCRLGLKEERHIKPVVTVMYKQGKRLVENFAGIKDLVRARYGNLVDVQLLKCCKKKLTMREQVELMRDTSVLLVPAGGMAAILNFLPPAATAITMSVWNTNTNRSESDDDNFYQSMEYPTIEVFPVTLNDYQNTTDRPECEIVRGINERADQRLDISGHLFNCNIHLQGDAMQRLLVYVDAALIRWAERTGRYAVLEPLRKIARRPSLQTRLIG